MAFSIKGPSRIDATVGDETVPSQGGGYGYAIQLKDDRATTGPATETVTLSATKGIFHEDPPGDEAFFQIVGPKFSQVTATGQGTNSITLTGPFDAVNAVLGVVGFKESSAGADTVTITAKNSLGDSATQQIPVNTSATPTFTVTSEGETFTTVGDIYTGPVSGLTSEYIDITSANVNVMATQPNVFINTGSGNDRIDVSAANGTNVLDGGGGNNVLVGGTGSDQFYVDDRNSAHDVWTTVAGFHSGDSVTVWGLTPNGQSITPGDNVLPSAPGLDFSITAPGKPTANLTIPGYSTVDLKNGRLTMTFGHNPDMPGLPGSDYMLIRAV